MSAILEEKKEQPNKRTWSDATCSVPIDIIAAIQFLTIVPPLVRRAFTAAELGRAVGWFALVGVALGAFLAGADLAFGLLLPRSVTAALILILWVLTTGALHLDGLLDSCDGLFGGRTPEARLRIMRDERAGAFAVIGGILVLLLKYVCLAALIDRATALVAAAMLGRWAMSVAIVGFPYGRMEGLGRDMKNRAGFRQGTLATGTMLAAIILTAPIAGAIALVAAVATTAAFTVVVLRRVPGFTGDTYGALCELVETSTLLVFVAGEMP
jgi:adenosylcobinamide-GDP ribazoletransferase